MIIKMGQVKKSFFERFIVYLWKLFSTFSEKNYIGEKKIKKVK